MSRSGIVLRALGTSAGSRLVGRRDLPGLSADGRAFTWEGAWLNGNILLENTPRVGHLEPGVSEAWTSVGWRGTRSTSRRTASVGEIEEVVETARSAFPRRIEDDKWLVWGSTSGGRLLQVVFVLDDDGTVFVIHARDLTDREKRSLRRKRK